MLESTPPLDDERIAAIERALREAGLVLTPRPPGHGSRWRAAAAEEAVRPDLGEPYAPSPRSTRGATRA